MSKFKVTRADHQDALRVLLERYEYDPSGGIRHKGENRKCRKGTPNGRGYSLVAIRVNGMLKHIQIHTAVWLVCKGYWPKNEIDHIDGDKLNNRIENMRDVRRCQNEWNKLHTWKPNSTTNMPGIMKVSSRNLYKTWLYGRRIFSADKYKLFHDAVLCGKNYK